MLIYGKLNSWPRESSASVLANSGSSLGSCIAVSKDKNSDSIQLYQSSYVNFSVIYPSINCYKLRSLVP